MSNDNKDVIHNFDECPDEVKRMVSGDVGYRDTREIAERAERLATYVYMEWASKNHNKLPRWIRISITLAIASGAAYLLSL